MVGVRIRRITGVGREGSLIAGQEVNYFFMFHHSENQTNFIISLNIPSS